MTTYYMGLDAGSTYMKAALIAEDQVVSTKLLPTGIDCEKTAAELVQAIKRDAAITSEQLRSITATGYSRRSIRSADSTISEITAHAWGSRLTAPKGVHPRLLIDIGGQDSKIISMGQEGQIVNFTMNDKCAAGTGKFLEVVAELLETTIDQIPELAKASENPCQINSTCAVFAQTEVISLLAQKRSREDILAGMHLAMANRIAKMARKYKSGGDILMTGGGAKNDALRTALEDELMTDIQEANFPQYNGAIGAALIGKSRVI
ncbi:acyl-CoA dehydratase activase [Pseudoramibacter alactolyticus]|uniref:acyl-CoA dehydratase activase n=1 Tax=Pseudoramibacter alactolyticus TaxID=113287 RepID=UPI0028EA79F8|nr:acyl-CoA dehydratase activase [Pseudoramibacter alactolyticus]